MKGLFGKSLPRLSKKILEKQGVTQKEQSQVKGKAQEMGLIETSHGAAGADFFWS